MATYRLSEAGMTGFVRKARRQTLVTTVLMFAGMLVVAVFSSGTSVVTSPVFAAILAVLLLLFSWAQWRSAAQAKRTVQSMAIEIDDHELKHITPLVLATIRREDVVELRYLSSGIMVLGRDFRHRIFLSRELDQFNDLACRLEEWAPANTIRKTASPPRFTSYLVHGVLVGSLGLFIAAVFVQNPKIAIPCCLAEAIFLVACAVSIWAQKGVASRLKWFTVLVVPLAFVFLQKACTLWKQP